MSSIHKAGAKFWGAAAMIGEQPVTWTPDTIQALIKVLEVDGAHKAASALTWALEQFQTVLAERNNLLASLAYAEAERDAANARAESARDKALEEAALIMDRRADKPPGGEDQNSFDGWKAGMTYTTGASDNASWGAEDIRALKEAGK